LLYLFQAGEERTRAQMIKDLNLDMTDFDLQMKLLQLIKADLISQGETNFDYKIAKDKTYELVFRRLFQEEIDNTIPDIRKELPKRWVGTPTFKLAGLSKSKTGVHKEGNMSQYEVYRGVSGFYDPAIPAFPLLKSVSRRREKKERLRRDAAPGNA